MTERSSLPRGPSTPESHGVLGPGQARVLAALRQHGRPATVDELRAVTGLGSSTLREHLGALTETGWLTRARGTGGGRGRPRWVYVARESPPEALAQTLVDALGATGDEAAPGAVSAGRSWGHRVVSQLGSLMNRAESARERVELALTHTGFDHEPHAEGMRILGCPLLEHALRDQAVTCGAHLGLLQGVLDRTGVGRDTVGLVPFDPAGGCLVRVG